MKGINGYIKTREYGSDIHTFELSKSKNDLVYTVGKDKKLETLSVLYKSVPKVIAAINCGFFNGDGSIENLFTFAKDAGYTAIYTKGNRLILVDNKTVTPLNSVAYNAMAKISPFGVGYTLVVDGKILIKTIPIKDKSGKIVGYVGDPYSPNPRTMIGQMADGSILLVVVQGRTLLNKGMTATQQAQFMLSQGCINAADLDGGGSSEIIVNNKIMNKPTDGHERSIGSALLVVTKVV